MTLTSLVWKLLESIIKEVVAMDFGNNNRIGSQLPELMKGKYFFLIQHLEGRMNCVRLMRIGCISMSYMSRCLSLAEQININQMMWCIWTLNGPSMRFCTRERKPLVSVVIVWH